MSKTGFGFNLRVLSGTGSDVDVESFKGQKLTSITLEAEANNGDGAVVLRFGDDKGFQLYDCARSCCESRYITTYDDIPSFSGSDFVDIEVAEGPETTSEYGEPHETAFLKIKTSLGVATFETHNEHNGYYGGIYLKAAGITS